MKDTKTTTQNKVKKGKRLTGVVVSTKMTNSITVVVESKYAHPLYGKIIKVHKKYMAHCNDETVKEGDRVIIKEGSPASKRKSFYFVKKVEKK